MNGCDFLILFKKYEVLNLLFNSEESKIYLVNNKFDNKKYVIKALYKNILKDYLLKKYYKEIEILNLMNHDRIPKIHEFINQDDWIYIVMEYIDGSNLEEYLIDNNLSEMEGIYIFKELVEIVSYFHKSFAKTIIHRDIKPSNVILYDSKVYLIDFGSARYYDPLKNKDTVRLGTRGYAAPEQYDNTAQTDVRTDIYGIGITMYYLFTKQDPSLPPYEIYPIRKFNNSYSVELENIIRKCINLDPNKRYQSCDELINEINLLLEVRDGH